MARIRILVPVDRPNGLDPAFERGLALARATDAELHLIHAVPADQPFSSRGAQRLQRWAELRQRAEAAKVTLQTIEQHGDPAGVIAVAAAFSNVLVAVDLSPASNSVIEMAVQLSEPDKSLRRAA
jgi:nucleotide-binding universal stress UspA family protein